MEFGPIERRDWLIRFKDLGFQTAEKLEKKINRNISYSSTLSAGMFTFYLVFVLLNRKTNDTVTAFNLCPE